MKKVPHNDNLKAVYFILISFSWLAIGWLLHGLINTNETQLVEEVFEVIQRDFPGDIPDDQELTFAAVQGMLSIVDDPYAVVVPPPSSLKFDADFAGETGGVGLVPNINEVGQMFIETVIEGGTAEAAGVKVGDILLSIDGIPVNAATTVTGSALLFRGPVGEPVELRIQRGEEVLLFMPIREARIALEWEILEGGVGYIAQHTFTTNVPDLFEDALTNILATNPPAIIWDVRFNGGGSMMVAQEILSNFIEEGVLFKVTLKDDETQVFRATGDAIANEIPLVILVNEFTFSAAETVAAAIQENGRGLSVGSTTFGKGTIQNTLPLSGDHLFEYTIGHWVSPKGTSYQDSGFTPEIIAPDDPETAVDETLATAVRLALASSNK